MVSDSSNRKAFPRDAHGIEQLLGRLQPAGPGRPASAVSGTTLRDSELIDLLRRAMAGEGYPVSGGRETAPVQDNHAPLTSRIRDILQSEPEPAAAPPKLEQRPVYEPRKPVYEPERFAEPEPVLFYEPIPPQAPAAPGTQPARRPPAQPAAMAAESSSVIWTPSLRAVGFVILAGLAGGSIPALMAPSPEYVAEASLKLVGDARSTPGMLDATASRLISSHVLSQAVARLKLETNPEFNGGGATAYGVAKDIFTDNGGASDNLSRAQAGLRERLVVTREPQVGSVRLSVRTEDAPQSIRIANFLAQVVASDSALSPDATFSLASDTSRKAYDDAMAALDDFKARAGEDKISAALKLQQQKQDLDRALDKAVGDAQAATIRLAAAKAVRISDVLSGSLSPDLGSPAALEDLRNRYASAKSALTMLATQLGPRHPRLLAQQATVDTLSGGIMSEIQKLVSENDLASKQANEQVRQLKARAAAVDTTASDVDMEQLEKLQADADAARSAYESELSAPTVSSSTGQAAPVALVAPATAAPAIAGGSIILNEIYGLLAGFAIALCIVAARMFARHLWREPELAVKTAVRQQPQPVRQPAAAADHHPVEPPQMRFDARMPVANDRPLLQPVAPPPAPVRRPVDPGVIEARQNVAALRARLESYAAKRPLR